MSPFSDDVSPEYPTAYLTCVGATFAYNGLYLGTYHRVCANVGAVSCLPATTSSSCDTIDLYINGVRKLHW